MMDFLKTYPFITMEEYYWKYSMPMIRLMAYDATRIIYLSEKQAKKYNSMEKVYDNPDNFINDLGLPVFG